MGTANIDERGRVVIPKELRQKIGLKPDQKVVIEARGEEIILKPAANVGKFAKELKGCVRGSKLKPSELKEIWGSIHAHH